jgi:hypothetical protein
MSAATASRSVAPAELAAEEAETRAGGLPAIIYLPDQSQPKPTPATGPKPGRHTGRMKGRHFGPRPVKDPLDARFNVRCTAEFLARLMAAADAAGLSLSAFVCAELGVVPGPRAHRRPAPDAAAVARIAAALGRSGNNLNQILRVMNSYDFRGVPQLLDMRTEIRAAHAAHHALVAAIKADMGL